MPPYLSKRRSTKTILLQFAATDTVNMYINIPFLVDHVVLKAVARTSYDVENDEQITSLKCNLFKEPLFMVTNDSQYIDPAGVNTLNYSRTSSYQNLNLYHEITNNTINSTYEFSLKDVLGGQIQNISTISTILVLQLEFVEKTD